MEVRPVGKGTLRLAGTILADSFWDYPEVVHLLPSESRRHRIFPHYLMANCIDALRFRRSSVRTTKASWSA